MIIEELTNGVHRQRLRQGSNKFIDWLLIEGEQLWRIGVDSMQ
ncbi:uncharacterized protein [Blastocystis hominis]|uniref:Uncharacterized protein n=1 Tax=Blastocystis hominis TaxID=12968 RepID=D8LZY4_BLAHO|nr:uncharacterized protein [Blastocystis hominis]CBK21373.2 unnamed protein product [Blastocystis hominis]|eukprot:XP_012895421.1 uncharacterized protein [Blastocystis hominis]